MTYDYKASEMFKVALKLSVYCEVLLVSFGVLILSLECVVIKL